MKYSRLPERIAGFLLFGCFTLASNTLMAQSPLSANVDEPPADLFTTANTVNISGTGELSAYKDVARVSLLVTTEADSRNQAMAVNHEIRQRLIERFTTAGIPASDILNSNFSSSPRVQFFRRDSNSFRVAASMEVSVSTGEHLQLLAAAADDREEVEFAGTKFEHSLEDEFQDQVRELAMQEVMEQKSHYETSLNLQLKAVGFFYGGNPQMNHLPPVAIAVPQLTGNAGSALGSALMFRSLAARTMTPTFDEVKYQSSINVVFEIINEE